jgi:hypothetical protein
MSNIIETTEDGWGCVPQLKDAVSELKFISNYIYEINNCVRTSDLTSMVEDLNETMDSIKYHLSKINVNNEYKTI